MRKISFIFILLSVLVVFRKFFLPGALVWGDAPYFYKEGLNQLIAFPMAWTSRGNALGNINLFIWIEPLMFLYGALGRILHLNNDLIIRILFYLPSLFFGFSGVYFISKKINLSSTAAFFAVIIYLINTYFLLLIDGGQVGVVLAYGLFPLVLYFLIRLIDKISIKNFSFALISSFFLTVVDFRIAAICIFTALLWEVKNFKKYWIIIVLAICLLGLSLYWLIPTLKLASNAITTDVAGLQTTSLLNSLFLFSPNWPANQFGKTIAPYFYFSIIPILIFLPLFIKKERKTIYLVFLFLLFSFLAKGSSNPFGGIYNLFISTKLGSVFRDSTKFFMPLMLIGGILIGISVDDVSKKIKEKNKTLIFKSLCFLFILFLVWQSILGIMNGVLGKNTDLSDFEKVYSTISKDNGFLRDAWFIEKSPFAFHTETKQALDAKDLVNFRPFASMNIGTGDHFNFINNSKYLDWFSLLGIKYLVFNGNPRVTTLNESDLKDWNRLEGLIAKDNRLVKLNLGTSFPVYQNPNIYPHEFFVDKTFVVIGGDDIYKKFSDIDAKNSVGDQGVVFAEDGKLNLASLQNIASTSAILVFNGKSENDLKMSFLQKYFISPSQAYNHEWAIRKAGDYLTWKYELLQNNISTNEFDYNQGIAFSSQTNEKLNFSIKVPEDGNYYLEIRSMNALGSGALRATFNHEEYLIKPSNPGNFEWFEKGPIQLTAGSYSLNIENTNGFQIVNTVALVPTNEMNAANVLSKNFLAYFQHFDIENKNDDLKLKLILENSKWENLENGQTTKAGWIIYTDSYDDKWVLQGHNQNNPAIPMYSMINGFYVDPKWGDVQIVFGGEEYIRWGIYFSVLSLLIIIISLIYISTHDRENKKNN